MQSGKKILSVLMSAVLVMGLMPLPAFADSSLRAGGFAEPQEEAAEPEGSPLQEAADAAGSALSALGASVMGEISTLGSVQDDPVVLDSGTCGENLTWEYWDDARLVISGTGEMDDYTAEGGQPWNKWLTKIEVLKIGEGATSIGDYAFYSCVVLNDIVLPGGLVSIGDSAFAKNTLLEHIVIPDSVISIGARLFENDIHLVSCHLPEGISLIPEHTFYWCKKLESVDIPDGVASIERQAFTLCVSLSSLVLPSHLQEMGWMAFDRCNIGSTLEIPCDFQLANGWSTAFSTVTIDGGLVFAEGVKGDAIRSGFDIDADWVYIPSTMDVVPSGLGNWNTGVGDRFKEYRVSESNPHFASVDGVLYANEFGDVQYDSKKAVLCRFPLGKSGDFTIPDGVRVIEGLSTGKYLTSVYIPSSVELISCGLGMPNLSSIDVDEGNSYYRSIAGSLYSKDGKTLIQCPVQTNGSFTMPDTVESIYGQALSGCSQLVDVVLSPKLTEIPGSCFSGCERLRSVYIPKSVTKIGHGCFDGAWGKSTNWVRDGFSVFYGGSEEEWQSINIREWNEDLLSMPRLYNVRKNGGCSDGLLYYLDDDSTLHLQADPFDSGDARGIMSDYLGDEAPWMSMRGEIKSVVTDESIVSIGSNAFAGCELLASLFLASSVENVGQGPFLGPSRFLVGSTGGQLGEV